MFGDNVQGQNIRMDKKFERQNLRDNMSRWTKRIEGQNVHSDNTYGDKMFI